MTRASGEDARVALLARCFGTSGEGVLVGIGDDAAVLAAPRSARERLVWTIDAQVEGVHFLRAWLTLEDLGFRAVMAAVSDLAAMGARPRGVLAALTLPPDFGDADLARLARGQARACRALGTALVGGNLARGGALTVTTSALGVAARPVPRAGARAGDALWLVGDVGLAAAGLAWLERAPLPRRAPAALAPALDAWRRPRAALAAGLLLAPHARAAIDVSDGLALDVGRLARASSVCVVLEAEALVTNTLARAARALARVPRVRTGTRREAQSALDFALHGGEDYALVVSVPARKGVAGAACAAALARAGARRIGRVERAAGAQGPRLTLAHSDGNHAPLAARGFDHFARSGRGGGSVDSK